MVLTRSISSSARAAGTGQLQDRMQSVKESSSGSAHRVLAAWIAVALIVLLLGVLGVGRP